MLIKLKLRPNCKLKIEKSDQCYCILSLIICWFEADLLAQASSFHQSIWSVFFCSMWITHHCELCQNILYIQSRNLMLQPSGDFLYLPILWIFIFSWNPYFKALLLRFVKVFSFFQRLFSTFGNTYWRVFNWFFKGMIRWFVWPMIFQLICFNRKQLFDFERFLPQQYTLQV